jgi:hypothetical protein
MPNLNETINGYFIFLLAKRGVKKGALGRGASDLN